MNDEEIKQLLRELSESADAHGKSRMVRISLDPKRRSDSRQEEANNEDSRQKQTSGKQKSRIPAGEHEENNLSDSSQNESQDGQQDKTGTDEQSDVSDEGNASRSGNVFGRGLQSMRERIRRNNERREEIIRQGDLDPEDEDADPDSVVMVMEAGKKTKGVLQHFLDTQREKRAEREARREAAELAQAEAEEAAKQAKAEAEESAKQAQAEAKEAATQAKPEAEEAAGQAQAEADEAAAQAKPEAEEAAKQAQAEADEAAAQAKPEAEESAKQAQAEADEAAKQGQAETEETAETAGEHSAAEADAAQTEQAQADTDDQSAESSIKEIPESAAGPDIPLPRERRKAPVEAEDFESDAWMFRSADKEDGDEAGDGGSLRERYQAWTAMLEGKGIGRRERIMILIGIILALLLVFIAMNIVSSKRKTEHVTADEGLTVTVEKEPSDWTQSSEVLLGIQTGDPIQSITVNGVNVDFSGTTRTTIQVDAETETLEIMVVSQQNVRNAVVDISRIDTTAPDVKLSSEGGLVSIDASDARSGVAGVYYGKLVGISDIPVYTAYTEPFTPEGDGIYVYYAVDNAGNMYGPVKTNMTPAESIVLDTTAVSLFPGDTYSLQIQSAPEGAFLNGLTITSENTDVAAVDGSGVITARADGETDLTISADGLASVTCHVTVRSSAQVTISAIGDVTLGDDINFSTTNSFSTVAALNGSSYFFANVKDILSQDDITFANFEGTLTTQGTRADKTYAFRGDPSYTEILTEGSVEAVTLANNHSSDYGEISLTDTQQYLSDAGIEWVSGAETAVIEAGGVQVGLVGIYCVDQESSSAVLTQMREAIDTVRKDGAEVTVVAFHWGQEKAETPSDAQQSLAHSAIDSGADLVVGHHPHVLQGIEVYAGKYIVYSLGNFCFGGNSSPSDLDTMIFQATFHFSRSGTIDGTEVTVIPCSISSDATWNNYQPTPAEGDGAQRIINKINERSAVFGTNAYTIDSTSAE